MKFSIQPTLENNQVILAPLQEDDFEALYAVAANPDVWAQHPSRDRYKREVFQNFFDGALKSGGAYKIIDKASGKIAGSTRFYDYDAANDTILIGYTFYGTAYWGKGFNPGVKALMLDYIFQFVSQVYFNIGAGNIRSQIAIGRLGAEKITEQEIAYFGEASNKNFVYRISRDQWLQRH